MKLKPLYILSLLLLFFSCTSMNKGILKKQRDNKAFDKYEDVYDEFVYYNIDLKFKLEFDSDWRIKHEYRHFDRFQKKYASFILSDESEVLFIGFNEEKKIGIKATAEKSSLAPPDYFGELRNLTGQILHTYNPNFMNVTELTLKNIGTFHAEYEIKIQNNVFRFRTIIFRKESHIIKIDIWTEKNNFTFNTLYIDNILQSVDVLDEDQLEVISREKEKSENPDGEKEQNDEGKEGDKEDTPEIEIEEIKSDE